MIVCGQFVLEFEKVLLEGFQQSGTINGVVQKFIQFIGRASGFTSNSRNGI